MKDKMLFNILFGKIFVIIIGLVQSVFTCTLFTYSYPTRTLFSSCSTIHPEINLQYISASISQQEFEFIGIQFSLYDKYGSVTSD